MGFPCSRPRRYTVLNLKQHWESSLPGGLEAFWYPDAWECGDGCRWAVGDARDKFAREYGLPPDRVPPLLKLRLRDRQQPLVPGYRS